MFQNFMLNSLEVRVTSAIQSVFIETIQLFVFYFFDFFINCIVYKDSAKLIQIP